MDNEKKYAILLNRPINLEFNGEKLNSYKLTEIKPYNGDVNDGQEKFIRGEGKLYRCLIDWENKSIPGSDPVLLYDTQTLEDLLQRGRSECPGVPALTYRIIDS
jgi:hypothetical protein